MTLINVSDLLKFEKPVPFQEYYARITNT